MSVASITRWRWPRSAADARIHAGLAAALLWALLLVTFAAGSGNRSIAGPIKGPDFLQFYTSAHLVRTGQTARLYDMAAMHETQVALVPESGPELYPPVYPPQLAILLSPLSALPYQGALLLWTAITLVAFVLIVRSAWSAVSGALADWRLVALSAAAFPPFWNLVLHGQVTILVLAAFWAGWISLERGRPFVAGCAFGLLLVKPQFGIPLAVIVLATRNWRMLAGAATSVGAQVVLIAMTLGTPVIKAYLAFVPVVVRHADLLEPKPFQSHSVRALTRLLPDWAGLPLWALVSLILLWMTVRAWKSAAPLRVRLGVVILVSVLVNPHLIVYDATVLVLPLLWFGALMMEPARTRGVRTYWTLVYWLCVLMLAPSAAVIGLQLSVVLMFAIALLVHRTLGDRGAAPSVMTSRISTVEADPCPIPGRVVRA